LFITSTISFRFDFPASLTAKPPFLVDEVGYLSRLRRHPRPVLMEPPKSSVDPAPAIAVYAQRHDSPRNTARRHSKIFFRSAPSPAPQWSATPFFMLCPRSKLDFRHPPPAPTTGYCLVPSAPKRHLQIHSQGKHLFLLAFRGNASLRSLLRFIPPPRICIIPCSYCYFSRQFEEPFVYHSPPPNRL